MARCLEGPGGFFPPTAAPIATGWSDPVAGRELHPLKIHTFARRTQKNNAIPTSNGFFLIGKNTLGVLVSRCSLPSRDRLSPNPGGETLVGDVGTEGLV